MKKLIMITLGLLGFFNICLAEITIFNKSTAYDMDVTYTFCYWIADKPNQPGNWYCQGNLNTVVIQHKKKLIGKNYITIPLPKSAENFTMSIVSATEKDKNGKIILQEQYQTTSFMGHCDTNRTTSDQNANSPDNMAIVLDDMQRSPMITCNLVIY